MTRLGEIFIQTEGNRAVLNADVQKQISFTEDQVAKLKDLNEKFQAANRGLQQVRQDIGREEFQARQEKNTKALADEIGKILTDAQKAKLKELGGKPFEADKDGI